MVKQETFRIFSIVFYEEQFDDISKNIVDYDFKYILIHHLAETEDKKNHYHLVIYSDMPTTITKISNALCILPNMINVKDERGQRYTMKKTIGYLLHYNNKEKLNYCLDDIDTNIRDMVVKYYNLLTGGKCEINSLKELSIFIQDNRITKMSHVLEFCIDNDCIDILKKYQYVISILLKENY